MIVWLASYPRSGNTLLRVMLLQNFGIQTFSLYDDTQDIGQSEILSSKVGHVRHGLTKESFYFKARNEGKTLFVKTHDAPPDDSKAIYVIRDGRSAIISYWHYIKDFVSAFGTSLDDVIVGACMFGSWSDHYLKWRPETRPNTLVLRYDDLVRRPAETLGRISDFVDRPVVCEAAPKFDDLNALNPRFFRVGSDARNVAELEDDDLDLFWLLHGPLMERLGYGAPDKSVKSSLRLSHKVSGRIERLKHSIEAVETARRELEDEHNDLQQTMRDILESRWWRFGQMLRCAPHPKH